MCCFSTKTEVFQTSIFARITRPGEQLLVYQMRYESKEPTAMILPLPVTLPAREGSVRWKSLEEHPRFFGDLAEGFPELPPSGFLRSAAKSAGAAATPIEVHEVGSFVASFVPSVGDFDRVDPRFAIRKDVWSQIPGYADHGFAVFQLKELSGTPHPIAFEFETRLRDKAFFPTVHIHDGTVHAQDTFDHVLYLQEARFDARVASYDGPEHADPSTGFVRSKEKTASFADASGGVLDGGLLLHRTKLVGMQTNADTLIDLAPRAAALGCGRCAIEPDGAGGSARLGAFPAAAAALGWLIRRRDRLRRS